MVNVCRYFAAGVPCKYGQKCRFAHNKPAPCGSSQSTSKSSGALATQQIACADKTIELLKKWRFTIPRDVRALRKARAIDIVLFVQQALELVETGSHEMQVVVQHLASEGGLFCLAQLLSYDYDELTDVRLETAWETQLLPYFQILSHEIVIASAVVAREHTILLNNLFGTDGQQCIRVFRSAVRCLSARDQKNVEEVEVAVTTLACVLEKVGSAHINTQLQEVAEDLITMAEDVHSRTIERSLRSIRTMARLGAEMAALDSSRLQHRRPTQLPTFTIAQDLPGSLSSDGPRHDNDFEDIQHIQILPTTEELWSSRAEYLPHKDPDHWHLGGIRGLIDRQFRLVREDTVGQLRDEARLELERLCNPSLQYAGQSQGVRTHVYRNVKLEDIVFNSKNGLLFILSFDQPNELNNKSKSQCKEWWADSKRLTTDSLTCLLASSGHATFLVVHSPKDPRVESDGPQPINLQKKYTELLSSERAFVITQLTGFEDGAAIDFLRDFDTNLENTRRSLVEFPGIILPAFAPTLTALQHMARNTDVPFAQTLSSGTLPVPLAPAYSLRPGFTWRLEKLLADHDASPVLTGDRDQDIDIVLEGSNLDAAQRNAVRHALSHAFALIQGPPGTGKSFTGVKLIQALLDNKVSAKMGPVICVCFTNHALDQLLEHLLDAGVNQVIRIGSQSKSNRLAPINLRNVAQTQAFTKTEKRQRWERYQSTEMTKKIIQNLLERLRATLLNPDGAVEAYIKDEMPSVHQQLFTETGEDGYKTVHGRNWRGPLQAWLCGGIGDPIARQQATGSLQSEYVLSHGMPINDRKLLYSQWLESITSSIYNELEVQLLSWADDKEQIDAIRSELDLRVLSTANIIGITTSGLARNFKHLRKLTSKVLVVEEAGEVLEAHLLTAMIPSLEHIILIGDHQQLRPKVQNYEMSVDNTRSQVALDVSLFERLVLPQGNADGIPFVTLEKQRRMHPLISQLIRSTLYPALQDAPSLLNLPEVVGLRRRLYWLDHNMIEDGKNEHHHSTSHTNSYEVDMVAAIVRHLVRQGVYSSNDIAVLTPYLGQLRKLRQKLGSSFDVILNERDAEELILDDSEDSNTQRADTTRSEQRSSVAKGNLLQALRLATVDNFQGEEAKIVIISLVRCNDQHKCGFLRTSNRINVLLSRAQHGMYIIGNAATSEHVPMWRDVLEILKSGGNFGMKLELCCPRHLDTPMCIEKPEDFISVSPEAGCGLLCDKQLLCGHACTKMCHAVEMHNDVYCLKDCNRPKRGCQHPCKLACGEPCKPKCQEVVSGINVVLPCNHQYTSLQCWQYQEPERIRCQRLVERVLPTCGHKLTVSCCTDVEDPSFNCTRTCEATLVCGHSCQKICYSCRSNEGDNKPEVDHGQCDQICGRNFTNCEHTCQEACHQGKNCGPCLAPCGVRCTHSTCSKKCHEPCTPCAEEHCSSACPHSACQMPCAAPCDWIPCSRRCVTKLGCGHQCPSVCGETCPSIYFCQVCGGDEVKEMCVDFITFDNYRDVDLDESPCIFLPCGHILTTDTVDGLMEMSQFYELDGQGHPTSLKGPSQPFSVEKLKCCPVCRASLRSVSRYGRIVRRSLLDVSTKKFITWSNSRYVELAEKLQDIQSLLSESMSEANLSGALSLDGSKDRAALRFQGSRYNPVVKLQHDIFLFRARVCKEEQPYQKVRDLVEAVRRRCQPEAMLDEFEIDSSILQTRAHLLARALLLRCQLVTYTDVVQLFETMSFEDQANTTLLVDFALHRKECDDLLTSAEKSLNVLQQAEAHVFWSRFAALEYIVATLSNEEDKLRNLGAIKRQARERLDRAQDICSKFPGQTASVAHEIDEVRKLLDGAGISESEMRMVVAAMAQEFSGTGHWYRCINGHPFTIGECGMPMETTQCPQCGASIGGQNHRSVEGVTHAEDLEGEFARLRI